MNIKYWFFLMVLLAACKEKYVVQVNVPASGFLVVQGFINVTRNSDIMMSRASGLDTPLLIPEPGAALEVQSQAGASFPLTEAGGGHYTVGTLPIDASQQYRLHIKTSNGKEYLSDFSSVKITPPIDSVGFFAGPDALTVYVSTHDNQSQPGYYQWQFEETWKYRAAYASSLAYRNGIIVNRPDSDLIYTCWLSDRSTVIDIANTEKLTSDVIYQFPITQVPYKSTNKLINRYSILVKQYALTKDWYQWNHKVQKNTEQLGSIFDAQPSQTGGNIHCTTNPLETVIGFVGITTETDKRIFIDNSQIPPVVVFTSYEYCSTDTTRYNPAAIVDKFDDGRFLPIQYTYDNSGRVTGVQGSLSECVDCRLRGGTTVKPSFWQ